jgi:diacylglycerol O-acyltransferase / wax synthase
MSIDRLSAEDELTLRWDGIWPQDIGAIAVLDGTALLDPAGRFRIEAARAAIASRLDLAPRFRQILYEPRRRGLGGTLWIDAPHFDLSDHIKVLLLPDQSGDDELLRATERLRRQRLDRSRPLWEMWFMPGLENGRIGLFVRWHHAIADGMAAMRTIGAFLDAAPDAPVAAGRPWTPAPAPRARALLADNARRRLHGIAGALSVLARPRATVRQVLAAWTGVREVLAGKPGPLTSLNRVVGPERNLALVRSRLDLIKTIAHTCDATVNDVLLAVTAGGLRALLQSRGEPIDGVMLPIYVPISLRRTQRGARQGNLIAQMTVPLPLGVTDPASRLRQIAAETAQRKAKSRASIGTMFRSGIATRFLLKAIDRQRVNVETADIPGPELPLYLAGARVLEVFPVLNLIAKISLGVGALSYAGTFAIGIVADRAAYRDIDVLAAGIRDELDALAGSIPVVASRDPELVHAAV